MICTVSFAKGSASNSAARSSAPCPRSLYARRVASGSDGAKNKGDRGGADLSVHADELPAVDNELVAQAEESLWTLARRSSSSKLSGDAQLRAKRVGDGGG